VNELLQADRFKFNTDEHILLDRRRAPYPKDLAEAKQLWSQRLRYEYLQKSSAARFANQQSCDFDPAQIRHRGNHRHAGAASVCRWNLHMAANFGQHGRFAGVSQRPGTCLRPHSDYFNTEHAQAFSIDMSLSLFGIGAQLTEDDGYCTINSLIHGGPAEKSKQLHEKDRILAVAQGNQPPVNVVDMEIGKVVQLIRGPKGTEVRLNHQSDGRPRRPLLCDFDPR